MTGIRQTKLDLTNFCTPKNASRLLKVVLNAESLKSIKVYNKEGTEIHVSFAESIGMDFRSLRILFGWKCGYNTANWGTEKAKVLHIILNFRHKLNISVLGVNFYS